MDADGKHIIKTDGVILKSPTNVIEIEFKRSLTLQEFEQFLRDLELDEDQIQEGIKQWKEN